MRLPRRRSPIEGYDPAPLEAELRKLKQARDDLKKIRLAASSLTELIPALKALKREVTPPPPEYRWSPAEEGARDHFERELREGGLGQVMEAILALKLPTVGQVDTLLRFSRDYRSSLTRAAKSFRACERLHSRAQTQFRALERTQHQLPLSILDQ